MVYCRVLSRWGNNYTALYQDIKNIFRCVTMQQELYLHKVIQCFWGPGVGASIKKHLEWGWVEPDMYWYAAAVWKIDSVYKQIYHSQLHVEECKYNDIESQQCSMLSDLVDDGYFEM